VNQYHILYWAEIAPGNFSGHYLVDRRQKARFLPAAPAKGGFAALPVENQHSHGQCEHQRAYGARQGQSNTLPSENRHFGRAQIALVLPNSQNACGSELLRTLSLVLSQLTQRHGIGVIYRASCSKLLQ
jgi:hypothetical protein